MDSQHHIFLSYSRHNSDTMRRIRADLRAAGLTVWTDEALEPGTPEWKREIEAAIQGAGCLVVLLSPAASASDWVRREIAYADAWGKRIYPALITRDARNAVPFELINYQRVDLSRDYTSEFLVLLNALRSHLDLVKPRAASKPPPNAATPEPPAPPKAAPAPSPTLSAQAKASAPRAAGAVWQMLNNPARLASVPAAEKSALLKEGVLVAGSILFWLLLIVIAAMLADTFPVPANLRSFRDLPTAFVILTVLLAVTAYFTQNDARRYNTRWITLLLITGIVSAALFYTPDVREYGIVVFFALLFLSAVAGALRYIAIVDFKSLDPYVMPYQFVVALVGYALPIIVVAVTSNRGDAAGNAELFSIMSAVPFVGFFVLRLAILPFIRPIDDLQRPNPFRWLVVLAVILAYAALIGYYLLGGWQTVRF